MDESRRPPQPYRSLAASLGAQFLVRTLSFIRLIVVARLLAPAEFGRWGLALAVLAGLEITTNVGLHDAVISAADMGRRRVEGTWILLVSRGLLVGGLLYGGAPWVAALVGSPDVAPLVRGLAAIPVAHGFTSLAPLLRRREGDTVPDATVTIVVQIVESVASIALVAARPEASSLVLAVVGSAIVAVGLSYLYGGFRPGLRLRLDDVRPLVRFGRWRMASNTLQYVATQGDDLVVGRLAGTGALGHYRAAFALANLPTTEISGAVGIVAYPHLARLWQRDRVEASAFYLRYLGVVTAVGALIAATLAFAAGPTVEVVFGHRYREAVVPLAIMSGAGFLRAMLGTGGQLFLAAGRAEADTRMQVWRVLALACTIWLVVPWGIRGAALASLFSIIATVPSWGYGLRQLGLHVPTITRVVLSRSSFGVAAAGVAAAIVGMFRLGTLPTLLLSASGSVTLWIAAVRILDRDLWEEMLHGGARLLRSARGG